MSVTWVALVCVLAIFNPALGASPSPAGMKSPEPVKGDMSLSPPKALNSPSPSKNVCTDMDYKCKSWEQDDCRYPGVPKCCSCMCKGYVAPPSPPTMPPRPPHTSNKAPSPNKAPRQPPRALAARILEAK